MVPLLVEGVLYRRDALATLGPSQTISQHKHMVAPSCDSHKRAEQFIISIDEMRRPWA